VAFMVEKKGISSKRQNNRYITDEKKERRASSYLLFD
jgi:hypothetical protein